MQFPTAPELEMLVADTRRQLAELERHRRRLKFWTRVSLTMAAINAAVITLNLTVLAFRIFHK